MSDLYVLLLATGATTTIFILSLWLIGLAIKDISIIDIFWGPACAVPALTAFFMADGVYARQILLTVLVWTWALRLSLYLSWRNLGHGEDERYAAFRQRCKDKGLNFPLLALWNVFLFQGIASWVVSLPVQIGQVYDTPDTLGLMAYIGVSVWAIGMVFEALGDAQLKKFKADPSNKGVLMTKGLWALTRHPNYFGNAAMWIGLTIIATENLGYAWLFISPIFMTFALMRITGVPIMERGMQKKYGEQYTAYKKRTSMFFPLPPKS